MFEKILVPVDGSKRSERAINIAVGLAAIHGAELLMLHVYRHHSLREQSMSMVRPADPGISTSRSGNMQVKSWNGRNPSRWKKAQPM